MDQGLGLKNTHPVDDASSSDVRIARGNSGHVFESEETDGAFILTVLLEGYRKEHVKIDPSEDGTRLSIFLEKPLIKKTKIFRIPDGVKISEIKAKFVELESTLRIEMPKVKKGIVGDRIEEWKQEKDKNDGEVVKEEGADIGTPQIAQVASDDEVPEKDGEKVKEDGANIGTPQITQAASDEVVEKDGEKMKVVENFHAKGKEVDKEENWNEIQELQAENPREIQESEESKIVKSKQADRIEKKGEDAKETIKEEKHGEVEKHKSTETFHQVAESSQETEVVTEPRIEKQERTEKKKVDECESSEIGKGKDVGGKSTPEKKPAATEKTNPLRTPLIIVGSALLVSIVLLAINRIRNRKKR